MRIAPYEPPVAHDEAEKRAKELLSKLSLEEKCGLVGGHKGFYYGGIDSIGLPDIYMADASQGVVSRVKLKGMCR